VKVAVGSVVRGGPPKAMAGKAPGGK